ncbi:hypothetical protein M0P65_04725 [Candidatus Gracilibacteria bacterium]|nr:hypothetical protein [Candidatus Gracilibacteria bacterium]
MIEKIINYLETIFFLENGQDNNLKEIYLDKTSHYTRELPNFQLDKVLVSLDYEKNIKNFLKKYKFSYNKSLYKKISLYFKEFGQEFTKDLNKENVIVCGVPLHFTNYIKRGYNQTYLLAKDFAKEFSFEFEVLLYKSKYTKSQSRLPKKERLKNLENAFKIKKKYKNKLGGKTIILIDDIISTGTTANEITKVLKENGAKEVIGLFLATGS